MPTHVDKELESLDGGTIIVPGTATSPHPVDAKDWNDVTESGYYVPKRADMANAPWTDEAQWYCQVHQAADGDVLQVAHSHDRTYGRSRVKGAWKKWKNHAPVPDIPTHGEGKPVEWDAWVGPKRGSEIALTSFRRVSADVVEVQVAGATDKTGLEKSTEVWAAWNSELPVRAQVSVAAADGKDTLTFTGFDLPTTLSSFQLYFDIPADETLILAPGDSKDFIAWPDDDADDCVLTLDPAPNFAHVGYLQYAAGSHWRYVRARGQRIRDGSSEVGAVQVVGGTTVSYRFRKADFIADGKLMLRVLNQIGDGPQAEGAVKCRLDYEVGRYAPLKVDRPVKSDTPIAEYLIAFAPSDSPLPKPTQVFFDSAIERSRISEIAVYTHRATPPAPPISYTGCVFGQAEIDLLGVNPVYPQKDYDAAWNVALWGGDEDKPTRPRFVTTQNFVAKYTPAKDNIPVVICGLLGDGVYITGLELRHPNNQNPGYRMRLSPSSVTVSYR